MRSGFLRELDESLGDGEQARGAGGIVDGAVDDAVAGTVRAVRPRWSQCAM